MAEEIRPFAMQVMNFIFVSGEEYESEDRDSQEIIVRNALCLSVHIMHAYSTSYSAYLRFSSRVQAA